MEQWEGCWLFLGLWSGLGRPQTKNQSLITTNQIGRGGFVRTTRAALRAAAKQVGATLVGRTVARLCEPPLNEESHQRSAIRAWRARRFRSDLPRGPVGRG